MNGDDALKAVLSINWVRSADLFFRRGNVYAAHTIGVLKSVRCVNNLKNKVQKNRANNFQLSN